MKIKSMLFCFLLEVFFFSEVYGDFLSLDDYVSNEIKKEVSNVFCIYLKDLEKDEVVYIYDEYSIGKKELPLGSIIKIFSIIAKFKNHPVDIGETHFCRGYDENTPTVIKCWLKEGHKEISLIPAIANSCNTYFYYFVQDIDFNLFVETLKEWKILNSSENWHRKFLTKDEKIMAMIGKMNILKIKPVDLLESCARLFKDRNKLQDEVREIIIDGMRLCYLQGTASKAREKLFLSENFPVICKTGTGAFEENGKINIRKTNGSFLGLLENRYLIFVFVEEAVGAGTPTEIGLKLLKRLNSKELEIEE